MIKIAFVENRQSESVLAENLKGHRVGDGGAQPLACAPATAVAGASSTGRCPAIRRCDSGTADMGEKPAIFGCHRASSRRSRPLTGEGAIASLARRRPAPRLSARSGGEPFLTSIN